MGKANPGKINPRKAKNVFKIISSAKGSISCHNNLIVISLENLKSIFKYFILSFIFLVSSDCLEDKNTFFDSIFKKDKNNEKIPKVFYLILSFVSF